MNNWFSFIAFGFCIGLAFSNFVDKNWYVGGIQAALACLNLPFMVTIR